MLVEGFSSRVYFKGVGDTSGGSWAGRWARGSKWETVTHCSHSPTVVQEEQELEEQDQDQEQEEGRRSRRSRRSRRRRRRRRSRKEGSFKASDE